VAEENVPDGTVKMKEKKRPGKNKRKSDMRLEARRKAYDDAGGASHAGVRRPGSQKIH